MRVALVLGTVFFVGQGCARPTEAPAPIPAVEQTDHVQIQNAITADASTYEPYTAAAYEKATAEGKPILLNFYANWCPTCAAQEPRTTALFINHQVPPGIAAFRVNFNDNETDDDERAIAKEFGVTYQHTYVYLDASGNESTRTIGTTPDETILTNLKKIAP